jgi:hypothetical protein
MLRSIIQFQMGMLATKQVKLEDVFQSTKDSMSQEAGPERLIALGLGAVVVVVVLIFLQKRVKADVVAKPVNHQSRLIKEVMKTVALKEAEMKQLKQLANEASCSNPLVLLMCPSLMAKALAGKSAEERKAIAPMIKKLTAGNE